MDKRRNDACHKLTAALSSEGDALSRAFKKHFQKFGSIANLPTGWSFGKLVGAERLFFQAACSRWYEAHVTEGNFDSSMDGDTSRLFSSLSLHEQLSIIAGLLRGLLLEAEPLPPERPEYYAGFVAMYQMVLYTEIACEEDMQRCEIYREQKTELLKEHTGRGHADFHAWCAVSADA
ncbi:unnamed protein product, partial [Symbiodinium sp. CCMP2456]